eukprot:scaffold39667_cov112-Isochrysis_galbana.AAC.4
MPVHQSKVKEHRVKMARISNLVATCPPGQVDCIEFGPSPAADFKTLHRDFTFEIPAILLNDIWPHKEDSEQRRSGRRGAARTQCCVHHFQISSCGKHNVVLDHVIGNKSKQLAGDRSAKCHHRIVAVQLRHKRMLAPLPAKAAPHIHQFGSTDRGCGLRDVRLPNRRMHNGAAVAKGTNSCHASRGSSQGLKRQRHWHCCTFHGLLDEWIHHTKASIAGQWRSDNLEEPKQAGHGFYVSEARFQGAHNQVRAVALEGVRQCGAFDWIAKGRTSSVCLNARVHTRRPAHLRDNGMEQCSLCGSIRRRETRAPSILPNGAGR